MAILDFCFFFLLIYVLLVERLIGLFFWQQHWFSDSLLQCLFLFISLSLSFMLQFQDIWSTWTVFSVSFCFTADLFCISAMSRPRLFRPMTERSLHTWFIFWFKSWHSCENCNVRRNHTKPKKMCCILVRTKSSALRTFLVWKGLKIPCLGSLPDGCRRLYFVVAWKEKKSIPLFTLSQSFQWPSGMSSNPKVASTFSQTGNKNGLLVLSI